MLCTGGEIRTNPKGTFSPGLLLLDTLGLGRPESSHRHQLYVDTGGNLGHIPGAMDNRDTWQERERERVGELPTISTP